MRGRCGAAAARAGFWGPPDRRAARRAGRGLRGLAAPGVPWGGGRERRGLLADSSRLGPAGSPLLSSREGAPVRRRVLEGRVVRWGAGGPGRPRREATPGAARLGLAPGEASASADAVARIRDVDRQRRCDSVSAAAS